MRLCLGLVLLLATAGRLEAQEQPGRQFVSVSMDWFDTQPLHFEEHPLEELAGLELSETRGTPEDYRSADGLTTVTVPRFRRRNRGGGISVFPFGMTSGPTLAVRIGYEQLPEIRFDLEGPGGVLRYRLTNARAYDLGAGVIVSDRSGGWGLGSYAYVLAGAGKIRSDERDGNRVFFEGGGGLTTGPLGVGLTVKVALNRLSQPRAHSFYTVPLGVRATLTF